MIENYLLEYTRETRIKGIIRTLVIDPTSIIKRYANQIENLCYDRMGTPKHIEHYLVPVYASIRNLILNKQ